jgi:ATP-dependent RNA circularization protein (DNA/RNA ligase family)
VKINYSNTLVQEKEFSVERGSTICPYTGHEVAQMKFELNFSLFAEVSDNEHGR